MRAFIDGAALFISQLGVPFSWAQAFIALVAVSFALTSLDSGTRLLRYNINEIASGLRLPLLTNRHLSSLLAAASIGFFAFYEVDGKPAGLLLWEALRQHQPGPGRADAADHRHLPPATRQKSLVRQPAHAVHDHRHRDRHGHRDQGLLDLQPISPALGGAAPFSC